MCVDAQLPAAPPTGTAAEGSHTSGRSVGERPCEHREDAGGGSRCRRRSLGSGARAVMRVGGWMRPLARGAACLSASSPGVTGMVCDARHGAQRSKCTARGISLVAEPSSFAPQGLVGTWCAHEHAGIFDYSIDSEFASNPCSLLTSSMMPSLRGSISSLRALQYCCCLFARSHAAT